MHRRYDAPVTAIGPGHHLFHAKALAATGTTVTNTFGSGIHRRRDGFSQAHCGRCDSGSDNRENQRIFGRRGARFILEKSLQKGLHGIITPNTHRVRSAPGCQSDKGPGIYFRLALPRGSKMEPARHLYCLETGNCAGPPIRWFPRNGGNFLPSGPPGQTKSIRKKLTFIMRYLDNRNVKPVS